jgi:hypothetical protein
LVLAQVAGMTAIVVGIGGLAGGLAALGRAEQWRANR